MLNKESVKLTQEQVTCRKKLFTQEVPHFLFQEMVLND
jgi:hypothetical protein